MLKYFIPYFFCAIIFIIRSAHSKAVPDDSHELVGLNLAGLQANLNTNLFASDGPLAQLGNEIFAGTNQLEKELNNGAQLLQSDANRIAEDNADTLAGVNIGGLKASLNTNLFSNSGPLAQLGSELAAGAGALENDIQNGVNALGQSLADAAGSLQLDLGEGVNLKNLENQISGGASLDNLLNMGNNDQSSNQATSTPQKSGRRVTFKQKISGLPKKPSASQSSARFSFNVKASMEPKNAGAPIEGTKLSNSFTTQALPPEVLAQLLNSINLSDICKGIGIDCDNVNLQNVLDELFKLLQAGDLDWKLPALDFQEILETPDLFELPPPVQALIVEKIAEALPIIIGILL